MLSVSSWSYTRLIFVMFCAVASPKAVNEAPKMLRAFPMPGVIEYTCNFHA